MNGLVFDIQHFSIHDGPGIRTTVFLKGCNLNCEWCHNPESISGKQVLQLYPQKCIHCLKCAEVCPQQCISLQDNQLVFKQESCVNCGECTKACFAQSRQLAGKEMSTDEVMGIVRRDIPFYKNSGGGITVSGGEPMLQQDFLLSLLKESKKLQLHTAVDTAGNVPFEWFERIRPYVDLFLYDMKIMNPGLHEKYTGVSNERILENLKRLADGRNDIFIRIPVIPTVNETEENMRLAAEFLSPLKGVRLVEFLPYHPLGEAKYRSLGKAVSFSDFGQLPEGRMVELAEVMKDFGIPFKAKL